MRCLKCARKMNKFNDFFAALFVNYLSVDKSPPICLFAFTFSVEIFFIAWRTNRERTKLHLKLFHYIS